MNSLEKYAAKKQLIEKLAAEMPENWEKLQGAEQRILKKMWAKKLPLAGTVAATGAAVRHPVSAVMAIKDTIKRLGTLGFANLAKSNPEVANAVVRRLLTGGRG